MSGLFSTNSLRLLSNAFYSSNRFVAVHVGYYQFTVSSCRQYAPMSHGVVICCNCLLYECLLMCLELSVTFLKWLYGEGSHIY